MPKKAGKPRHFCFLCPHLPVPLRRKKTVKRCHSCYATGTRGFSRGIDGLWYGKHCLRSVNFRRCVLCNRWTGDGVEDCFECDDGRLCGTCWTPVFRNT